MANSALFNRTKVEDGITLVSLLRTAAEIEPSKLVMPFSENDKANMKGWFEFKLNLVRRAIGVCVGIITINCRVIQGIAKALIISQLPKRG